MVIAVKNSRKYSVFDRRNLISIHGYIAVFFLPMAVLYAITGAFYVVGVRGNVDDMRIELDLPSNWPTTTSDALDVAAKALAGRGVTLSNTPDRSIEISKDEYLFRSLNYSFRLTQSGTNRAVVTYTKNGLYRQFVEIHKDHAGSLFSVLGFAFGIALFVLLLSGTVLILQLKQHRTPATYVLVLGTLTCSTAYILAIV